MQTHNSTFVGKELLWLAKLSVCADDLILFYDGSSFSYVENKLLNKIKLNGESYARVGSAKKFRDLLWHNKNNGQRADFIKKLVNLGILQEVDIEGRIYYEFNQDKAYNVFVSSNEGETLLDFFRKHSTLFIEK